MIDLILYDLAVLAWLLYAARRLVKQVHMLQLNSYRNARYFRWVRQNIGKIWALRDWAGILPLVLLFIGLTTTGLAVWTAAYALLFILFPQEQEKKKLVYTMRVKRLLVTLGVLALAAAAVVWFAGSPAAPAALIVLFMLGLLPFVLLWLGNVINQPLEQAINRHYLNDAKRLIREMKQLNVVGITGSFGKTSVKHFLHTVLAQQFDVLMTPESYNTPMGVTKTIRSQLRPTHRIFISEMGAKQRGDIREICDLVSPRFGILTSIGEQHLETFKSIENIKRTKFELIESLPEDGIGFLNMDNEHIAAYRAQAAFRCRIVTFGIHAADLDYRAGSISYSSKGTRFTVTARDGRSAEFETVLLGEHNVQNLLACIAVGLELGMPLEKLTLGVRKIKPVIHRLELKPSAGGITILDDSFNSNPVGSGAALDVLGQMEGKKVLITPGMIELGEKEYELNKAFGLHAAEVCDYIILVGQKQTKPIQDGLAEAGYPAAQTYVARHLQDALAHMRAVAAAGSIVLLENDLPDNYNE